MKGEQKKYYLIVFSALIGVLAAYFVFSNFGKNLFRVEKNITNKEKVINFENKEIGNRENEIKTSSGEYLNSKIKINQKDISVEIPLTDETAYRGLGGRFSLGEDKGMLFVFSEKSKHAFVMRRMNFDLDFIFINDNKIVDIQKNISKDFEGNILGKEIYNQVLEINAGVASRNNFSVGDNVSISYR